METFTQEEKDLLGNYVSNMEGNIYVIYNLPPEVVAVLFAYVSRSPNSFRRNLLKLLSDNLLGITSSLGGASSLEGAKEKARKFHEKWVVGYGHSSVAEHACASLAIEDVSILATKVIEDNRLASYTEKSTRYQVFDKTRYYKPKKLMESGLKELYCSTMDFLFDEYNEIIPTCIDLMRKKYPKGADENDAAYESKTKARACDVARYILPAGTLTNLGMTANARTYEYAIAKLLSDGLEELNLIGEAMKAEVVKLIPTLVKYAERNKYIVKTEQEMPQLCTADAAMEQEAPYARLVAYDAQAYDKVVTSIMYRYTGRDYSSLFEVVRRMSEERKEKILEGFMKNAGKHDHPLRELEHIYYTFDILLDYGAFRDIQRHRICTQTNQVLSTSHGYSIPEGIKEAGLESRYKLCMERADRAFKAISDKYPLEAQYVVPLAYRKRVLITWNLRELFHFIRLRSSKEGHISYRRVAWGCYDEVSRVHPMFSKYLVVDKSLGPSR